MTYQINIPQIHCSGCVSLIKLYLDEVFSNVEVDQNNKTAKFFYDKDLETTKTKLDEVFIELKQNGYDFTDLVALN